MKILFILAIPLLLISCDSEFDDQTIVKESQLKVINPAPIKRNFEANNANHKVIVAVMDTGVDYNHPYLKDNIHFDLDEAGNPTGSGWDYAGNDSWAAPFVGRTDFFNEKLSASAKSDSFDMFNASKKLLTEFPELKQYFPAERNIEEEQGESFEHGTHVAGLASYDSTEIGIRGYRVVPVNRLSPTEKKEPNLMMKRFTGVLLEGLSKAIADGSRVINMSLGLGTTKDAKDVDKAFSLDLQNKLIDLADTNPQVVFVVAAGNDGKWIDGRSSIGLPCFVPRKNVICVSALSEDLTPTTFTNIVLSDEVTTIYAWGEKILSTVPTGTCSSDKLKYDSIKGSDKALKEFGKTAIEECAKDQSLREMSGTSMASPVVARKVAKIIAQYPDDSVEEIKDKLFASSIPGKVGAINIMKLPIEKPSWYNKPSNNKMKAGKSYWNFMAISK